MQDHEIIVCGICEIGHCKRCDPIEWWSICNNKKCRKPAVDVHTVVLVLLLLLLSNISG